MQMTQIKTYAPSLRAPDCPNRVGRSTELTSSGRRDPDPLLRVRLRSNADFEEFHKLYSKRLYKRILSITRNHEDAEDALQDTFIRAFTAFDSFEGRSHVSTWLTRIAINTALTVIRRRRRGCAEFSLTPPSIPGAGLQVCDVRDPAPTPEEIYDVHQRSDKMYRAIERLDPTLRNAIEIQITQECSTEEIAYALNVSVSAVKTRLHRARKTLIKHVTTGYLAEPGNRTQPTI
jgi:RNA polymerase sigma-70 factor (ECF subfamily)